MTVLDKPVLEMENAMILLMIMNVNVKLDSKEEIVKLVRKYCICLIIRLNKKVSMKRFHIQSKTFKFFYLPYLDIDDCIGQTCSGNGQCNDLINDYECKCTAGFAGRDCETSKKTFINANQNYNEHISYYSFNSWIHEHL